MKKTLSMNRIGRWLVAGLMALAWGAEAETKTREIDSIKERNPSPDVRVTTEVHETRTRTTGENKDWETTRVGTQSRTTETDWHGEWDDNKWEGEAGIKNDRKTMTQTRWGNSTTRAIGTTRLEKPETVWKGKIGPSTKRTVKGRYGTATVKASAGAEASVRAGENGYEGKARLGLEAEVQASTRKLSVGNSLLGASLKGSGRAEASLVAKGRFGAYVDNKGITIGAEGTAGAYLKGELKLSTEAHVFGVKTNVNLMASGYAGAMAQGKAVVTLGWNGKVSFMASLGASLGLGGGLAVEFEMDADELMAKLNFTTLSQLLEWMKEFQENPMPVLAKLGILAIRKLHEAGFGSLKKLGSQAATVFEHQVLAPIQNAGSGLKAGVQKGLAFLGRLIHSPRADASQVAVNDCLQQAEGEAGRLAHNQAMRGSAEFPLCSMDGSGGRFEGGEWEGMDPYGWYLFNWPSPYTWPTL